MTLTTDLINVTRKRLCDLQTDDRTSSPLGTLIPRMKTVISIGKAVVI